MISNVLFVVNTVPVLAISTEHLASHSSERKYICHICQKCFISCRHLKLHCKVHADDQPNSLNLDEGHMGKFANKVWILKKM
ncbi:hypothetical protein NQ317_005157 [Molorchus minor]|uniref:C2H2-type domain-containing protein n=1 Tax=Molorchus minor TaxID=1323400 RepID=A0ABQ9K0V3_9CUCU|nr:hypothetical protein NQ317_005157 [Molorchus minor]